MLVVMSVFEPAWYVRETLTNTLAFTSRQTGVVLHFNRRTEYADSDMRWFWTRPRVEVNCWRTRVTSYSKTLLLSQALSIKWAACRGAMPKYVLFQASNMWWIRTGVEQHVQHFQASMFSVQDRVACETLQVHGHPRCKLPVPSSQLQRVGWQWGPSSNCTTSYILDLDARKPLREDGLPVFMSTKHEGSFYPFPAVLRAIATLVPSSSSPDAHESGEADPAMAFRAFDGGNEFGPEACVRMLGKGYPVPKYAEEYFFQTWYANYERAGPFGSCPVSKLWDSFDSEYIQSVGNDCGSSLNESRCTTRSDHLGSISCQCRYIREMAYIEPQFFAIKAHSMRKDGETGQRLRETARAIQRCFQAGPEPEEIAPRRSGSRSGSRGHG